MLLSLRTLALAFWFGGGLATLFATRAIFRGSPDRKLAGDLSGLVLRSAQFGRFGWALPFLASSLAPRGPSFAWGCVALAFAVLQLATDAQVRALRVRMANDESLRARFGALHGASVMLLVAHVLCAGVALVVPAQ